ncbi:MAG: N-formylglutamate amidohydrolase [Planctomycetes bacterium]|nr:N-formylglutamate amidohydrolase [Planctomycetota bacterium]
MLFTCEHGGNRVPREFADLFRDAKTALESHRGYDPGALPLAKSLAGRFEAAFFFSTITRLLVELNRSPRNRRLFSEFTSALDATTRQVMREMYYDPYRRQVETWIENAISQNDAVLHVSVHTFTPELNGVVRNADVGLLYDPSRRWETDLCRRWRDDLAAARGDLRVRRNFPYLGKADGFTTHLRRRFAPERYAGVELEVNQLWPRKPAREWRALQRAIGDSLSRAVDATRDTAGAGEN